MAAYFNLRGGPKAEDFDRIEHFGTANVASSAARKKVERLSYLSGAATFVSSMPIGLLSLIGVISFNPEPRFIAELMRFFEKVGEGGSGASR